MQLWTETVGLLSLCKSLYAASVVLIFTVNSVDFTKMKYKFAHKHEVLKTSWSWVLVLGHKKRNENFKIASHFLTFFL